MHVNQSQPLGPRQPGRSDSARPAQRAGSSAPAGLPRDVYEGRAEPAPAAGPDRLDLSSADLGARADHLPGPAGLESPAARAERLESLARELAEGRLFSPERLQRAASRLLGGE